MDLPLQISEPKALILLLTIPFVVGLGVLSFRARPRDRARIATSTVLRSLILALLIGALAGLQIVSAGGPLNVVFLIDESASVSQASQDAAGRATIRSADGRAGPERSGRGQGVQPQRDTFRPAVRRAGAREKLLGPRGHGQSVR